MLNRITYENWFRHSGLPDKALEYIWEMLDGEPARCVSSAKSHIGTHADPIIGKTMQFESDYLEFSAILKYRITRSVFTYRTQPTTFIAKYKTPNGKNGGHGHVPDMLVLRRTEAGFEEWKMQRRLETLAEKNPNRYIKDNKGRWHFIPGERHAEEYGLYYRVFTEADINYILRRNTEALLDYYFRPKVKIDSDLQEKILNIVKENEGLSLFDLIEKIERFTDTDSIYFMVVRKKIFIDIESQLITDPPTANVFSNLTLCKYHAAARAAIKSTQATGCQPIHLVPGQHVTIGDSKYIVLSADMKTIHLQSENGQLVPLQRHNIIPLIQKGLLCAVPDNKGFNKVILDNLLKAPHGSIDDALVYLEEIQPAIITGKIKDAKCKKWTAYKRLKKYKQAELAFGCGLIGLVSQKHKKGNHNKKRDKADLDLCSDYIENHFLKITAESAYSGYKNYKLTAQMAGKVPVSFNTFHTLIKAIPVEKTVKLRHGDKAAYQEKFIEVLYYDTPIHGDRCFHIVHIDHTELSIMLVCTRTGKTLGKVWLTLMVDAFSRRVLAFVLSFEPPSYRSCMLVIREFVKRHNRLPFITVVDHGSEFESNYFKSLLALPNCTIKYRKTSEARDGNIIERLFGVTEEVVIYCLQGNTQPLKNPRQMTKETNPELNAIWTIERLEWALEKFFYEAYDNCEHSTLGVSPREMFEYSMKTLGPRHHLYIAYDLSFYVQTLPSVVGDTARVTRMGVKINNFWYTSPELKKENILKKDIPAKYDPHNAGIAFVYFNGSWQEVRSKYYSILRNLSESQDRHFTTELTQRLSLTRKSHVSDRMMAELIHELLGEEPFLRSQKEQRLREEIEFQKAKLPYKNEPEQPIGVGDEPDEFDYNHSEIPDYDEEK